VTIPGLVGVEHISQTVPDVDAAVAFFVEVFGAEVTSEAAFSDPDGDRQMAQRFNTHPAAVARLRTLDLCGVVLELFEYDAPDLDRRTPRNCDAGGHHIGLRVREVAAAARYLEGVPGVRLLGEPSYEAGRDGQQRGWVYFLTPWGAQMELADSRPHTPRMEPS
jgi:catechol 2,3-dioxygenase-like lactoylglutathione lyase family enzyme